MIVKISFFNKVNDVVIVIFKKCLSKKKQQNIYVGYKNYDNVSL